MLTAERVSDKIYSVLQSDHYCSRRLNATHQVGCQSELGGNLGVVWMVSDADDLQHILTTGPTPPYVPILTKNSYTRDNLLKFKENTDRVSGVVFLDKDHDDSKSRSTPFSPEYVCPNRYSGLYVNDSQHGDCSHHWQEESPISGLLYDDFPYPIFLINEKKSIDNIVSCFNDNNVLVEKVTTGPNKAQSVKKTQASYPLCGIQLDSFMVAAKDSEFCLNSHFIIDEILQSNPRRCQSVDNYNIFAYFKPSIGPLHVINSTKKPDTNEAQSIVMLVTKLSSLSMFSEISPGADSTITSIITLLAVAEALGRVKHDKDVEASKRNIAFAILDSEPFDYTGSSRIVYDMLADAFPRSYFDTNETRALKNTNLESIDYLINLDQMSNYPNSDTLFLHSDSQFTPNDKLDQIVKVMKRIAATDKVKLEIEQSGPLPPTSVHEFIKGSKLKSNRLTGLVLSNYGKTYSNLLYHSIYDDKHNIYQPSKSKLVKHLEQVAKFIARSLYEITFKVDKSDNISIDSDIIEQLLDCYLEDAQCPLFTRATQAGQKLPSGPIPTYKDPNKHSDDLNGIITRNLLAYFIGDREKSYNATKCSDMNKVSVEFDYQYINDKDEPVYDRPSGTCLKSQVMMMSSGSPAYSIAGEELVIDNNYPAWTVSLNSIRNPVRLYLIPNPLAQWSLFTLGVLVTITSFIIVLTFQTRLKVLNTIRENELATST